MLIAATKRENTMISTIITTAIVINFAHFTKIAVWIIGQSKFKFTTCTLAFHCISSLSLLNLLQLLDILQTN